MSNYTIEVYEARDSYIVTARNFYDIANIIHISIRVGPEGNIVVYEYSMSGRGPLFEEAYNACMEQAKLLSL